MAQTKPISKEDLEKLVAKLNTEAANDDPTVAAAPKVEGVETKREKFERLAASRVNKAINAIRLLGNLSTYNYEWAPEHLDKIRMAIVSETEQALSRFNRRKKDVEKPAFTFTETPAPQH